MTTIVCEVTSCPYFKDGFCRRKVVAMRNNGQCGQLVRKDLRPNSNAGYFEEAAALDLKFITLEKKKSEGEES